MLKLWLVGLLAFPSLALANPCAKDTKEFCEHVEPGQGQLMRCLQENESQISAACKKEVKSFKDKMSKQNPCYQDLAEYCGDMDPVAAKVSICLLKNETRLSATCAKDFAKKKPKILEKDPCAPEVANRCYAELIKGGAEASRCLMKNKDKLGAKCVSRVNQRITKLKAKNPCFDDTEKFCPVITNRHDIDMCLQKNLAKLAPLCKKIQDKEIKIAKSNPCHEDIKKHCKPGLSISQKISCLDTNESLLTNACQQLRKVEKEKVEKMKTVCEADRKKHCGKVEARGGKIKQCLKKNVAKLTKECKELF